MKRTIAAVAIALIAWPTSAHAEVVSEPTAEPTTVSTPVAEVTAESGGEWPEFPLRLVLAPRVSDGETWHDCEDGWEYAPDLGWNEDETTVTIVSPDGSTVGIDRVDVLTQPGAYEVRAKTNDVDAAFSADDLRGWTVVSERDGYATEVTMPLVVEFDEAPDCTTVESDEAAGDDDTGEDWEEGEFDPIDEPEPSDDEPELHELVTTWNQTIA